MTINAVISSYRWRGELSAMRAELQLLTTQICHDLRRDGDIAWISANPVTVDFYNCASEARAMAMPISLDA